MTYSHAPGAILMEPPYQSLMQAFNSNSGPPLPAAEDIPATGSGLSYREAPDGSVPMGADPLTGMVVLIVQSSDVCWEIALPPKISRFASSECQPSLAAAKQVAEAAFDAYRASRESI